ncbi:UNVERIFIED_CONTAM: hypothetical protein FKN15_046552 [Acipenser sinensis]
MPVRFTQLALTLQSFSTEDVCSAASANRSGDLCAYPWKRPLLPKHVRAASASVAAVWAAFTEPLQRTHSIRKRGLLELAGVIKCSTGRSALAYIMYGCYCGLGGQGWPRDKADWCCHKHDCCYERAEQAGCKPKTDKYHWTCEDRVADCDHMQQYCMPEEAA